ncbi:MAG: pyridoxal phosphate-dependent class II aminotransferase [Pseudorhodobacter sp.]|nr:pyridoxal phosphate-dependent class II aminotransferase [Pseudorhodobacter sp.]
MRDHGGNLDWAMRHYGGTDWIDLSTGINRVPYPVEPLSAGAWTDLPTRSAMERLLAAARVAYRTEARVVALSGAQGAIQMIPVLSAPGLARVLGPTYNEHTACLRAAGWRVEEVAEVGALAGADLAVVVNPNNPDGRRTGRGALMDLLPQVGRLVVDESFADARAADSVADQALPGLIVLRSFGKFYGLAGLRLGFAMGDALDIERLAEMAGPWPVSGAAIEIGTRALLDGAWSGATIARLQDDVARLDLLMQPHGVLIGGTALFRLYGVPDAAAMQETLARGRIWSRIFPYSTTWIRLGIPGDADEFFRLAKALAGDL